MTDSDLMQQARALVEKWRAVLALAAAADTAEAAWCSAPAGSGKSRANHQKFERARDDAAEAAYQFAREHGCELAAILATPSEGVAYTDGLGNTGTLTLVATPSESASVGEDGRDAARYRDLRDKFVWVLGRSPSGSRLTIHLPGITLERIGPDDDEFDAAIDAARALPGDGKEGDRG